MIRRYAFILGLIAFVIVVLRSLRHGAGVDETILFAWAAFGLFAGIGYVAAWIGIRAVDESVNNAMQAELDELKSSAAAHGVELE